MTLSAILPFAAVVGLLTLTPGMDTALILRTAALGEPRRACCRSSSWRVRRCSPPACC